MTILGYSLQEYGFFSIGSLCEQFEIYFQMNGIDLAKKRDEEVF